MADTLIKKIPDYYFNRVKDISDKDSMPHLHQALEIYFLLDGQCNYLIGNRSFKVVPGDIVLVPSGMVHNTIYNGKPRSRVVVNCSLDYVPQSIMDKLKDTILYHNSEAITEFMEIFDLIEKEQSRHDEYASEVLRCLTITLLLKMLRHPNEYVMKKEDNSLVNKALAYLHENYMNDVKLSSIAKMFSVSSEHLSRVFKKETGTGFNEYLTSFRLQKAEFILRSCPNKPISEIAYACGFNDGNYFSYKFKEVYGISPIKMKGKTFERKSFLPYEESI